MTLAYITGSGFYDLPGFKREIANTRFGEAHLLRGQTKEGRSVILLPRHRNRHEYLPHQINHRANLLALKEAGAGAIISFSICGVVNPDWPLAAPFLATDLYYPDNRLGDGSMCTLFTEPGETSRGHLLAGSFFNQSLRKQISEILAAAVQAPLSGCYAHVPGPRFDSKAEIAALRGAGVDFLSQTCGPEAILANELEIPYALVGFGVDYANGVQPEPTPVETLNANMKQAKTCFESIIEKLSNSAQYSPPEFENFIYRFE
jgi:purine nucleoside phosphorylase